MAENGRPIGEKPYVDQWSKFVEAGKEVFVIADVPRTNGQSIATCLEVESSPSGCAIASADAFPSDAMAKASQTMANPHVHPIDLSDRFCIDGICQPVIGGLVVYSDSAHLTRSYSRSLAPFLEFALSAE